MGRDISSHEAVLLSLDDVKPLFRNSLLAITFSQYCLSKQMDLIRQLLRGDTIEVTTVWDEDHSRSVIDRGLVSDRLGGVRSGPDLHRLLGELTYASQCGEVGKYGNTYLHDDEALVWIWNLYITAWNHFVGGKIPTLESIETFGSGRNCNWAVEEFGHPYLAFSVADTFENVLTDKGRAMQQAFGMDISITSWTSVIE